MNEVGTNRTIPEKCPQCGASLPAGALAGLCPACLLQQGAAADTATGPKAKPFVPPTVEEVARLFPQLEILGFLGREGHSWIVSFSQPAEKGGCAVVNVTHTVKEWEARLIAVDKDGEEHLATGNPSGNSAFKQQTATFSQLPLTEVKEFKFQVRPYRWVEFRNVSLEPGRRTQVEIVDAIDK